MAHMSTANAQRAPKRDRSPRINTLNPRQAQFCRLYVATGNASEAYRGAGYASDGANAGAARQLAKVSIKAELERLRGIEVRSGAQTRAYVLDRLHYYAEHATPDSAAIRAAELLGKTERMFVEVAENPAGVGEVEQLKRYSLDELRELRAIMVDGVKGALEAPVQDVESKPV